MKNIERFAMILVIAACVVMSLIVSKNKKDSGEFSSLKDSLRLKDDTIKTITVKIDSLTLVNDSLHRITLWQLSKIDTTIQHIEKLSKPVITKEDEKEALKWVENYNRSL